MKDVSFGAVLVTAGKHRGKVGFYDDDDGCKAIVYFDEPLLGEYELIPHEYLKNTEVDHLPTRKLLQEKGWLCAIAGVK